MLAEKIAKSLSDTATKMVIRQFPYIIDGEYYGMFENFRFGEKFVGIRTLLVFDPELLFETFDYEDFIHPYLLREKNLLPSRYLSTSFKRPTMELVEKEEEKILSVFYYVGDMFNLDKRLDYRLDFFLRFTFPGNRDTNIRFDDSDISYYKKK